MNVKDRFMSKVIPEPNSGCWLWDGSYWNDNGYPRFHVGKKEIGAHRMSYELFCDEIPEGMIVCHKCDTPACVNPDHLFIGTHQDNTNDKVNKKRAKTGNKILTDDQAVEIKSRLSESNYALGKEYNVSPSTIWSIRIGRTFKHI